jgi:hypothetical protein
MRKQTVKKIEAIENKCLNNGNDFYEKAAAHALSENIKYGTMLFLGTVRQLVDCQEAGTIILG